MAWKLTASAAVLCALAACGKTAKPAVRYTDQTLNMGKQSQLAAKPSNPLHAATTYWAQQHRKNERDPKAALNYARNLKALGAYDKASQVLDQAYRHNPSNTEIASEYGRLAVATNNLALADRLLQQAERGSKGKDWRALSARGTLLAKQGEHKQAQGYFVSALALQPNAISVRNNLALSYAMSGHPQRAEELLREAVSSGQETPRIRQNLALVMGLQGKFGEAKQLASVDAGAQQADANMTYLRNMVQPAKIEKALADSRQIPPASTASYLAAAPAPQPKSLRPKAVAANQAAPIRPLVTATASPQAVTPTTPAVLTTDREVKSNGANIDGGPGSGWKTSVERAHPVSLPPPD